MTDKPKQVSMNFVAREIKPTKPFAIFSRITGKEVGEVQAQDKHDAVKVYLEGLDDE